MKWSFLMMVICINSVFAQQSQTRQQIDSLYKLALPLDEKLRVFEDFLNKSKCSLKDKAIGFRKMGLLWYQAGRISDAVTVTQKALKMLQESEVEAAYLVSNCRYNLLFYYGKLGEFDKRQEVLRALINAEVKTKFSYKAMIEFAYILGERGDYFKALEVLDTVVKGYASHGDVLTHQKAHEAAIWVYSSMDEVERYETEITSHERALASVGFLPSVANNLANIRERIRPSEEVVQLYRAALEAYEAEGDSLNTAWVSTNLGRIYAKLGKEKLATRYYESAKEYSDSPVVVAYILNNKGDCGTDEEKLRYNNRAIQLLLGTPWNIDSLKAAEVLACERGLDIVDFLLENLTLLIDQHARNQETVDNRIAFYITLIDRVFNALRTTDFKRQSKLFWLRKASSFYTLAVRFCYLTNNVEAAFRYMENNKALLLLEDLVVKKTPKTIAFLEAKALMTSNQVVVSYIGNHRELYGLWFTQEHATLFKVANAEQVLFEVKKLKDFQKGPLSSEKEFRDFYELNSRLFKALLPVREAEKKLENKELLVLPDVLEQQLNFETLYLPSKKYLISQTAVSYSPSMSVYHALETSVNELQLLTMAPTEFGKFNFDDLSQSEEALRRLDTMLPVKALFRDRATLNRLRDALPTVNALHLNTHAGTDLLKGNSWLAFYDQVLELQQIAELDLPINLLVLDACQGASGRMDIGEGAQSLAKAFMHAGTSCVIASQWNVNERASQFIFQNFYRELAKGKTVSKALRTAKLRYLEKHQLAEKSPYYWASFIAIGRNQYFNSAKNSLRSWWWLAVIFALIGIGVGYKKSSS